MIRVRVLRPYHAHPRRLVVKVTVRTGHHTRHVWWISTRHVTHNRQVTE